ncbi:MAG: NADPH-dependent FMN reductase [Thalassotalea sp.]
MKILAFGASNSKNSINQQLANYAACLVKGAEVEMVNLNDFELPIFSVDREEHLGQPELAQALFEKIGRADALVISFAEHNGTYTAAYKNIFDWMSRINQKVYQNKPMVMLAASPGPGGAVNVLNSAITSAPHFLADLKGSLSIKRFYDNFDMATQTFTNDEVKQNLLAVMNKLL